jgi:hypothetical protein
LSFEQCCDACADRLLVVHDDDADHVPRAIVGSVTVTSKPPPVAGQAEKVPPASVARSRMPARP